MNRPRSGSLILLATGALVTVPLGAQARSLDTPMSPVPDQTAESQRVRFETHEGTWMSVDVSPDGAAVVFDLVGRLYIMPITGGRAHPITGGPGVDGQPRFSPDGQRIAFVSDRSGVGNLWIVHRDGSKPRQISAPPRSQAFRNWISSPAWTPDGKALIVAVRFGSVASLRLTAARVEHQHRWVLAKYTVETGAMNWVTDTSIAEARQALGPVVTPDGRTVFAAVEPHRSAYVGESRSWHLERIDLSTGEITPEVAPSTGRWGIRPAISPDGRLLAYVSPSGSRMGLRLRDLRTLYERWLVVEQVDSPSVWGTDGLDLAPGYGFTPDSKAIVIGFGGKLYRIDARTGSRRQIPFVAEIERDLPAFTLHQHALADTARPTQAVMQAALSPDGARVAFSALGRIWLMDLPNRKRGPGVPQRLTADSAGEFYPSWSPDGEWIIYSRWQDGLGGSVNRAKVPSVSAFQPSTSERLTADSAVYFNTVVAPDGTHVFALSASLSADRLLSHYRGHLPDSVRIVSLRADGGAPRPLASGTLQSSVDSYGSWARADYQMARAPTEQLYFSRNELHVGLGSILSTMPTRGTDWVIADTQTVIRMLNDATGVLSPDGRRALVTHNWTLSEVLLPSLRGIPIDTFNVEEAQKRKKDAVEGAAARWGRVLAPWISWSLDGTRVLFVQGGTLFLGTVRPTEWTRFAPVRVPLPVPVDTPRGALVLRHARVITMSSSAPRAVIARADVVIRNNRIVEVGPSGTVRLPQDGHVLDMSGKTILPGYVDSHDHIEYSGGVHPQQCWACLVRLAYGVTTIRDPYAVQNDYNDIFTYQERERTGALIGPRIFSTGIVHYQTDRPILTDKDAEDIARPIAEYFAAETFKEYSNAPWPAQRLVAVAASNAGLNATIHGDPIRAVLDGFSGLEHNVDRHLYADVLTLMARSRITHTQTFGTTALGWLLFMSRGDEPWTCDRMRSFVPGALRASKTVTWSRASAVFGRPDAAALTRLFRNAAGLVNRGGRIAMGSHGDVPGLGFHWEMWFHSMGGMKNDQILRAATIGGATAIGHASDLGSLESGKLADLQILDKNPLEDIRSSTSVTYVLKNGRLYRTSDLTELWPRKSSLSSLYLFQDRARVQQGAPPRFCGR